MAEDQAYPGLAKLTAGNSRFNQQHFLASVLIGRVNTAMLVLVKAVELPTQPGETGFVTVQPMVAQVNGTGQPTPHGDIANIPYFRLGAGDSAVIIDPVVGDIGLAVFASRDISSVKVNKAPANPGSARQFAWSDGCYFGGFLDEEPTQFIHLSPDGIVLKPAPGKKVTVDGPLEVTGATHMVGAVTGDATAVFQGDVTGAGKHLSTHTHSGVTPGGGNTGPPT